MTPRCRCYVCCVEREMTSNWHFRSVTYNEEEFAPSHFQSTADDGDSNLHDTPHFFFIHHNKKNRHLVLWGSDEGSLGQDTSFLVFVKKKIKPVFEWGQTNIKDGEHFGLGEITLWTYFLIYWTTVFSDNRVFQILGSNDEGLIDTHVLAKFSCLWPFTLLSST